MVGEEYNVKKQPRSTECPELFSLNKPIDLAAYAKASAGKAAIS